MLEEALNHQLAHPIARSYKRSSLDNELGLADFDWRFNPKLAAPSRAASSWSPSAPMHEQVGGKPRIGKSRVTTAAA